MTTKKAWEPLSVWLDSKAGDSGFSLSKEEAECVIKQIRELEQFKEDVLGALCDGLERREKVTP